MCWARRSISVLLFVVLFFFFNDTATTEIYTLSLHDALPIYLGANPRVISLSTLRADAEALARQLPGLSLQAAAADVIHPGAAGRKRSGDRKSTRLNSSH